MPFVSERQRRFMWAKHPAIARRWAAKYGPGVSRPGPGSLVKQALKGGRK